MLNACALLKIVPTRAEPILEAVTGIPSVKKAYFCYGRFDVVAFIEAEDYKSIKGISKKINSIDGVRSTETLVEA
jgi:DNA-binding Lrp family transcriptional regulator